MKKLIAPKFLKFTPLDITLVNGEILSQFTLVDF
jgi:hypothetical protein